MGIKHTFPSKNHEAFSNMKLTPRQAYRQAQTLGFIDGIYKVGKEPNEWYVLCLDKLDTRWNEPEIVAIEPENFRIVYVGERQDCSRWVICDSDTKIMRKADSVNAKKSAMKSRGIGIYAPFCGYKYDKGEKTNG